MKYIIAALVLFALGFVAQAQTNRTVMADTNGVIQRPTNFFTTNRILRFDTNFNVIYTNTNTLTFTNVLGFGINSVAATRTNLGLGLPALTNTSNITMMRALAGSTNTNQPCSVTIQFLDDSSNARELVISNGIILSISDPL